MRVIHRRQIDFFRVDAMDILLMLFVVARNRHGGPVVNGGNEFARELIGRRLSRAERPMKRVFQNRLLAIATEGHRNRKHFFKIEMIVCERRIEREQTCLTVQINLRALCFVPIGANVAT